MSQEKVDRYKERKANREKIQKKEKRMLMLEKIAAAVVCIAIIGWIGYSVYGQVTASQDAQTKEYVMDATGVQDYLNNLQTQ